MWAEKAWLVFALASITIVSSTSIQEVQIEPDFMEGTIKNVMGVVAVRKSQLTHPTGDPNFSVLQPFPAAFNAQESDPFLMCDAIGPKPSKGVEQDPDKFPVQWHPHRGMDILSYLIEGVGRHADSLGNRGEYASPGMQWISVGSGIEHAEGGGTPAGVNTLAFQIWVNVPSERKMDDPRYGTEPPENIPVVSLGGTPASPSFVRVLAGAYEGRTGPFKTVTEVQILDITLAPGVSLSHVVANELDNCLLYVYKGSLTINKDTAVGDHECARLDAANPISRIFDVTASTQGVSFMLFAGTMLKQPIAWHGPFVMTTDAEIKLAIKEYQTGTFLKKRAAWDYKRIAMKF